MSKKNIWNLITKSLESDITQSEVKTWFSDTTLRKLDKNSALIEVPNKFVANWLADNYIDKIRSSLKDNLNFLPEILFTYGSPKSVQNMSRYKNTKESKYDFNHQLNPVFTFDNFITDKTNRFAYSSALQVAKKPRDNYNPLYIFSKQGLGKTHLLNAIGHQILISNPLINAKYISTEQLSFGFSLAKKNQRLRNFRGNYRNLDFLLLDDIHLLDGREKLQKELIYIFNLFYESKKQIVFAGKYPPSQIQNLVPQLRSRMEWGLISEIQPPSHKTRMNIIKKKAREGNLSIPDDVFFFLANATNDLKILVEYLVSLETYTSLHQRKINISIAKSIIKNKHFHKIHVHDVQKVTAEFFDISLSELLSNKKIRRFSYPRHVAMYLSRKLTSLSFKELAKVFGNKDHTTIIYAVKRIENEKDLKKKVLDDINKLQSLLS
jgi:chromosomal replication initiator protein